MSGAKAVQLLSNLRARNVQVFVRDGRLQVRARRGSVGPADRETLRRMKGELLAHLDQQQRAVLNLSLDEFAAQDHSIELAVPWLEETIWFVPRAEHIDNLVSDGIHRGRIWTAAELQDLRSIGGMTQQELVGLSRLKLAFGGEVLSVTADDASS